MSRGDPNRRECTDLERGGGGVELKLSAFCYDLPRVTHPQRPRERNIQQQFRSTVNRQAIEPHSALLPSKQT